MPGAPSQVIKVHAAGIGPPIASLRERVRYLEAIGVDGIFTRDHLFASFGRPRREAVVLGDPFLPLAVVGTLSEHLMLGTSMVNIGFAHPALAIRSFLELARLFGGHRVLAGIGAGWNAEEFDALGMDFPPFARRLDRLEEACKLARMLFDQGFADLAGDNIITRSLPMGPQLPRPPKLLIGGGSNRLLEIAGRYADVVDLNTSSRRTEPRSAQTTPKDLRMARTLWTTTADLEDTVHRVLETAAAAGRDRDRIEFSISILGPRFCSESEIETTERELCRSIGIDPIPLGDCPYVFVGPPERMRQQLGERIDRIGLRHLIATPAGKEQRARFNQSEPDQLTEHALMLSFELEDMARFSQEVVAPVRVSV